MNRTGFEALVSTKGQGTIENYRPKMEELLFIFLAIVMFAVHFR